MKELMQYYETFQNIIFVRLRVLSDDTVTIFRLKTIKQVDRLANKMDEGSSNVGAMTVYSSNSHLALIYTALKIQSNLQKEILVFVKIMEDIICNILLRKYIVIQLMQMVVRLVKHLLLAKLMRKEWQKMKQNLHIRENIREKLKKYRENKISSYDFCDWIEKHK